MSKKIKMVVVMAVCAGFLAMAMPVLAVANDYGLAKTAGAAKYATSGAGSLDVFGIVRLVVNIGLSLLLILFAGLVIFSGVRWLTARGAEEHVTKAKDTLEAAVIGLILVLAAYAITSFVFGRLNVGNTTAGNTAVAPGVCAGKPRMEKCGDNQVCDGGGGCITECALTYPNEGVCIPRVQCTGMGSAIKPGLCPGATADESVCCWTRGGSP